MKKKDKNNIQAPPLDDIAGINTERVTPCGPHHKCSQDFTAQIEGNSFCQQEPQPESHLSFSASYPDVVVFNRTIGERLFSLRKEAQLSLQDLGIVLDVSSQQISKYEKGIDALSVYKLMLCAHYFEVDYDYFFE